MTTSGVRFTGAAYSRTAALLAVRNYEADRAAEFLTSRTPEALEAGRTAQMRALALHAQLERLQAAQAAYRAAPSTARALAVYEAHRAR